MSRKHIGRLGGFPVIGFDYSVLSCCPETSMDVYMQMYLTLAMQGRSHMRSTNYVCTDDFILINMYWMFRGLCFDGALSYELDSNSQARCGNDMANRCGICGYGQCQEAANNNE